MKRMRSACLSLAVLLAVPIIGQAAPEPLDFSGAYNCDGYVTVAEGNAVNAWYTAQGPDFAAAFYGANRNKYFKAPNVAFAVAGPWAFGGAHNTAFDNDMTWFFNPANPAQALASTTVTTGYATYSLALNSGFDSAPLPDPGHGVALPARLNMVRFGLIRPTATSVKTADITVPLAVPVALENVNFLLTGMSGYASGDVRPRFRIQANYADGTTTNLFTSPSNSGGKPAGVPSPNAGQTFWGAWTKTATLQPQMWGNYMLSQTGSTNDPCRPYWKTIPCCMVEPAAAGLPLDPKKAVTGFTFSLNATEQNYGAYTGGEDVNIYAMAGTVARPAGTLMLVR